MARFGNIRIVVCAVLIGLMGLPHQALSSDLKATALQKLDTLENLMQEAQAQSLDVTREETLVWFSKEFLKFADWDEANRGNIQAMFGKYYFWRNQKVQLADELAEFEREKVNEMLDRGIFTLRLVLDGTIQRRPAVKVDWENVELGADQFVSKGKPAFLYDYFSKSLGNPTSDPNLYNDHLGNVDTPACISTHFIYGDGSFDEGRLNLVSKHPDTRIGYTVLWHMEQPDWIYQKDTEVGKGTSLFIGYDIDNPMMRDSWGRILEKVGRETRGKKANKMGYMLVNEPHWHSNKENWFQNVGEMTSISRHTLAKYRGWLSKKYRGNIHSLNAGWKTQFKSFDQVQFEFPISESMIGQPSWYDWCRFNMDRATDWMASLQGALQVGNPEAQTHVKVMPHLFTEDERAHGIDLEAITELTTMIGNDAKTRGRKHDQKGPEPWESKYAYFWGELCVSYDFMESVAPNKIHVNSESHFLSTSLWRELDMSTEYVRNCYWLATLLGMDANLTWFWARDPDGSPEQRLETTEDFADPALAGSFAGSINMQPHVANELTQVMMDLNTYSEEMMLLRRQRRPIRLFHSETSAINKHHHMSEQFKLYEALNFEGLPLGFVTEKILKKQDSALWDVVLVYQTEYATSAECRELQRYLDGGGTVIMDEKSLSMNEYGKPRNQKLKANGGTLITLAGANNYKALKNKALSLVADKRPALALSEENGSAYKGCIWRVASTSDSEYLLTVLNVGKNVAKLKASFRDGGEATCTNMLTGKKMGSSFEMGPNGVLLLEVKK